MTAGARRKRQPVITADPPADSSTPPEVPSVKGRWALTAFNTAVFAACATAAAPVEVLGAMVALTAVPPLRRALSAASEGSGLGWRLSAS